MESLENRLRDHVRVLASVIGSRSILEPEKLSRAQEYIHVRLSDEGLQVEVQEFEASGQSTANLIARIPGTPISSPLLVLGAHYDTVPGTPGADDNASAVAVLLETARLMVHGTDRGSPPKVLFAAFTTEEPPSFGTRFMGSRVFTRSLRKKSVRIRGGLILEMVGYYLEGKGTQQIPLPLKMMGFPDTGNFLAVCGDGLSRGLVKEVVQGLAGSGCGLPVQSLVVPGRGAWIFPEIRLSDNASFWNAGIPAVLLTDTSYYRNPHYHSPSDRPGTLNYEKMAQLVNGLVHLFTTPDG